MPYLPATSLVQAEIDQIELCISARLPKQLLSAQIESSISFSRLRRSTLD